MRRKFRDYIIIRTCTKQYKNYQDYKPYLKQDFSHRCAYCNLKDLGMTTTPFEVDHFIPRDAFKDEWPECGTLYENLVYSCKKCNLAKSSYFKGDISKQVIENEYFYDPAETDYGEIFFRNDAGGIASDDEKGRDMINKLKLYRPIHNISWLCETLKNTRNKLNEQIEKVGEGTSQGKIFLAAKNELNDYYITCQEVFLENYNNEGFTLESETVK